jgi:purine catabolism regulator
VRADNGRGVEIGDLLALSSFVDARLIAGRGGTGRLVQRLNVMAGPDTLSWLKANEILVTSGYALRHRLQDMNVLVEELDARGVAAVALKLGYIGAVPPSAIERADALNFPIIQLSEQVSFDDILQEVLTSVLNRQAAALARSAERHQAFIQIVVDGGGLLEITDYLAGMFGGFVAITDGGDRVLARSGNRVIIESCRGDGETAEMDEGAFINSQFSARMGTFRDTLYLTAPVMAGPLSGGKVLALGYSPETPHQAVMALEEAATVAALVVARGLAIATVDNRYRGEFLRDILTGRRDFDALSSAHARSLGWELERPVAVVVAELDPVDGSQTGVDQRRRQEQFAADWAWSMQALDVQAAICTSGTEAIAVIGVPSQPEALPIARRALSRIQRSTVGTFTTGLRAVGESSSLPHAYRQARQAIGVARLVQGRGGLADFEEMGPYSLLGLVDDPREIRRYVEDTLGPLAGEDPESVELRRTLMVLLEVNLNVAEAARQMHYHYNTLRYRLGKLEAVLGPFTERSQLQLSLMVALRLIELRPPRETTDGS